MVRNKNENEPRLVGALEKLAVAEKMKAAQRDHIKNASAAKGFAGADSQVIPITLVYVMSVVVALMLPKEALTNLPEWCPQWIIQITQLFSDVVLKNTPQDGDIARVVSAFMHGGGLFLMAGAVPLVANIVMRVVGRTKLDPFVSVWMTMVLLPLYFMLKEAGIFAMLGFH